MICFTSVPQLHGNLTKPSPADTSAVMDVKPVYDTTVFCRRNSIVDVTFYDNNNFIRNLQTLQSDRTIIFLARQSKVILEARKELLIRQLKPGMDLPETRFSDDWVIFVIVSAALLLTLVRSSKKAFHNLESFFLFRGVNESGSHNPAGLFQWQTTIRNLASFIIISLFIYKSASVYGLIPGGVARIMAWLICLSGVIVAFTFRHVICTLTGNLSGTTDVFNEYLAGVYQSYHFSALVLAILTIMMTYTTLLPQSVFVFAGLIFFSILYIFRITRLLIIFINRNISILYLILYLCALEILPVAIAIRYFAVSD